jgi:hypothetical protein
MVASAFWACMLWVISSRPTLRTERPNTTMKLFLSTTRYKLPQESYSTGMLIQTSMRAFVSPSVPSWQRLKDREVYCGYKIKGTQLLSAHSTLYWMWPTWASSIPTVDVSHTHIRATLRQRRLESIPFVLDLRKGSCISGNSLPQIETRRKSERKEEAESIGILEEASTVQYF